MLQRAYIEASPTSQTSALPFGRSRLVLHGMGERPRAYAILKPIDTRKSHLAVYLARPIAAPAPHVMPSPFVAIKITFKAEGGGGCCSGRCQADEQVQQARGEIASLQRLSVTGGHKGVIGLIDAMEDDRAIYTILPYVEGEDLCDVMLANPDQFCTEEMARQVRMHDVTDRSRMEYSPSRKSSLRVCMLAFR